MCRVENGEEEEERAILIDVVVVVAHIGRPGSERENEIRPWLMLAGGMAFTWAELRACVRALVHRKCVLKASSYPVPLKKAGT